jgi:serine/threonine protein phosphatase 1
MSGRTVAIGDIHGCAAALAELLKWIDPDPEDTLVFLGDYVDRGPDSKDVIEQVLALEDRCRVVPLLGNHEEMLLSAFEDLGEQAFWLCNGGATTLTSYGADAQLADVPDSHLDFLRQCLEYHETDTHLFLHANYVENKPVDSQDMYARRWESLHARTPGPHCSGKTVIVGHSAQRSGEVLDLGYLKCIDTCCYGGGWLTALDVGSDELWQTDIEGRRRGG